MPRLVWRSLAEEAVAGFTVHGEASVDRYDITESSGQLLQRLTLPMAQPKFERSVQLHGQYVRIREVVEILSAMDRPLAWTQHVTLSPPFLDPATTQFRASMTRSVVSQADPGFNAYLTPGEEFSWPIAPRRDGGESDLRQMHKTAPASGYTAHLADPQATMRTSSLSRHNPTGLRLRLEARGFPLAGYLGRKLQPPGFSVGRQDRNPRDGVRCVALS